MRDVHFIKVRRAFLRLQIQVVVRQLGRQVGYRPSDCAPLGTVDPVLQRPSRANPIVLDLYVVPLLGLIRLQHATIGGNNVTVALEGQERQPGIRPRCSLPHRDRSPVRMHAGKGFGAVVDVCLDSKIAGESTGCVRNATPIAAHNAVKFQDLVAWVGWVGKDPIVGWIVDCVAVCHPARRPIA